ncbi:MAG: DUF3105 domain-containing protein [Dehalococcoidia bacterium]
MSAERRRTPGGDRASSPNRTMLIAVGGVVAVVVLTLAGGMFVFATDQPLPRVTPAPSLLGEAVAMGQARHVPPGAPLEVVAGQPPAGGPHYEQPARAGIYAEPVPDGHAIHSLEHGIVWISYRPDLVSARDLEVLTAVAQAHARDVLLSPRPENSAAASVVSWGRRLNVASPVSRETVEAFVVTNVDQAPEPGIR